MYKKNPKDKFYYEKYKAEIIAYEPTKKSIDIYPYKNLDTKILSKKYTILDRKIYLNERFFYPRYFASRFTTGEEKRR